MTGALLVAAGAATGAPLRFLTDRWLRARLGAAFPWGTLAVNVAGSFVLGLVVTAVDPALVLLVGIGFCGTVTTYSAFTWETLTLLGGRARPRALVNLLANVVAGIAATAAGWALGSLL